MSTMPTRIDGELFQAAKVSGAVHSRSAAQQLTHWARLGRALETSPGFSQRDVEDVLLGRRGYDEVSDRTQAAVRVAWDEQIATRISTLDLTEELSSDGAPVVEADEHGQLVTRR